MTGGVVFSVIVQNNENTFLTSLGYL